MTNITQTPISSHAAKAVTQLIAECHLMEIFDTDAERIVQDAIDASKAQLITETIEWYKKSVQLGPKDYAEVIE